MKTLDVDDDSVKIFVSVADFTLIRIDQKRKREAILDNFPLQKY